MFNKSLNDELVNKIYHLSKALDDAKKNIESLQHRNNCLIDTLTNLASINKEDYDQCLETNSDSSIAI